MQSRINPNLKLVEAEWPEHSCGIAFVGEAGGENEALEGRPFVGSSGQLLRDLASVAGIDMDQCLITNVFNERPPGNDLMFFFEKKGKIKEEWVWQLERLADELEKFDPVITVAVGATALWALTGMEGITKYRGTILPSFNRKRLSKVLPVFHPAYVMRGNWQHRLTLGKDLIKAKIESGYRELVRPKRELWIRPHLEDLYEFERLHMQECTLLSADIETDPWISKQLLCIGFAPDESHAIVVPFVDRTKKGWSYWDTKEEEYEAYEWCRRHLEGPIMKLGQNFNYDKQWLWKKFLIWISENEDTMLMHHAMQPELEKSLGYMSSTYTNEAAFKMMVNWSAQKTNKIGA